MDVDSEAGYFSFEVCDASSGQLLRPPLTRASIWHDSPELAIAFVVEQAGWDNT